jgi:hypothetical protein
METLNISINYVNGSTIVPKFLLPAEPCITLHYPRTRASMHHYNLLVEMVNWSGRCLGKTLQRCKLICRHGSVPSQVPSSAIMTNDCRTSGVSITRTSNSCCWFIPSICPNTVFNVSFSIHQKMILIHKEFGLENRYIWIRMSADK